MRNRCNARSSESAVRILESKETSVDSATLAARYPFSHWGSSFILSSWGGEELREELLNESVYAKLGKIFSRAQRSAPETIPEVDYLYPENEVSAYIAIMSFLAYSDYPENYKMRLGGHYFGWITRRTVTLLESESQGTIREYYQTDLGLPLVAQGDIVSLSLKDYLAKASKFVSPPKRTLATLPLRRGEIILSKHQAADLAGDLTFAYLAGLLERKIQVARGATNKPAWISSVQTYMKEFIPESTMFDETVNRPNDPTKYPPCISLFVEQLAKRESIPHFARFAVASFMRQIGVEKDYVVKLFTTASDFRAEMTKYQVSHIYGEIGSHTSYTAPSCDSLKISRLCPIDGYCNPRLKHPVSVYLWKWRLAKGESRRATKAISNTE